MYWSPGTADQSKLKNKSNETIRRLRSLLFSSFRRSVPSLFGDRVPASLPFRGSCRFAESEMSKKKKIRRTNELRKRGLSSRPPLLPSRRALARPEFPPFEQHGNGFNSTGNGGAICRWDLINRNFNKCGRLLFISDGGIWWICFWNCQSHINCCQTIYFAGFNLKLSLTVFENSVSKNMLFPHCI